MLSVNTDSLDNNVKPKLNSAKNYLRDACDILSSLVMPEDFSYSSTLKKYPQDIGDCESTIVNLIKFIDEKIDDFIRVERLNASIMNLGVSGLKGVLKKNEMKIDSVVAVLAKSSNLRSGVKEKLVSLVEKDFSEEVTSALREKFGLEENSYDWAKSDSTASIITEAVMMTDMICRESEESKDTKVKQEIKTNTFEKLWENYMRGWEEIGDGAKEVGKKFVNHSEKVYNNTARGLEEIENGLKEGWETYVDFSEGVYNNTAKGLEEIGDGAKEVGKKFVNHSEEVYNNTAKGWEIIGDGFVKTTSSLGNLALSAFKGFAKVEEGIIDTAVIVSDKTAAGLFDSWQIASAVVTGKRCKFYNILGNKRCK